MATRRRAAATTTSTSESRGPLRPDDEVLDEEEEAQVKEIFELSTMVSTIDRIVVSLKRLNETISPGGALYESQKDLQDALTGRARLEDENKRQKMKKDPKDRSVGSDLDYMDDDDDEDQEEAD